MAPQKNHQIKKHQQHQFRKDEREKIQMKEKKEIPNENINGAVNLSTCWSNKFNQIYFEIDESNCECVLF